MAGSGGNGHSKRNPIGRSGKHRSRKAYQNATAAARTKAAIIDRAKRSIAGARVAATPAAKEAEIRRLYNRLMAEQRQTFQDLSARLEEYEKGEYSEGRLRQKIGMGYVEGIKSLYLYQVESWAAAVRSNVRAGLITEAECTAILEGRPLP